MDYKRGLATLRKLAAGSSWFSNFLIYEARLQENLEQERLYGASEQSRATRFQIIGQLNSLVYEHFGCSFNDLCQGQIPGTPSTSEDSYKPTVQKEDIAVTSQSPRTGVFISYSRNDKRYLEELHAQLAFYIRSGLINAWDDTNILPGAKWHDEINKAIQAAKVAVLLVSADFLASDFIARKELPPLLQAAEHEGTTILCVILRPCVFSDTELAQYQTVNAPSNPLSSMSRGKRDAVWRDVATRVKDILLAK
ncbi:MAG TPA: toll/interleukin-1 receptor domain-containing protein [Ktedonobacteraceae bacterium]|nr:toll/interleukin-1 receptor domain-containing protein [Ktedonobacteraceae bacterium]